MKLGASECHFKGKRHQTFYTQLRTSCRPRIPQSVACPTSTGIILGSETGQKIKQYQSNYNPWNWQIARENEWSENEISFWAGLFSGAMSVSGCFREGTWQKVRDPPKIYQHKQEGQSWQSTNVARGSVCFVQTWTPHLPSRCAQHPSKISGKSEGEVMPAAISPAWTPGQGNHVKVSSPYLPFLFMFLSWPPALAEKFHHP